jgi:hypothetical protein
MEIIYCIPVVTKGLKGKVIKIKRQKMYLITYNFTPYITELMKVISLLGREDPYNSIV